MKKVIDKFHNKYISLRSIDGVKLPVNKIQAFFFLGALLLLSACITQQPENVSATSAPQQTVTNTQLAQPTTSEHPEGSHWISVITDPRDFRTDYSYNITGSTILNITVYTEYPAGTLFEVGIFDENTYQSVLPTIDIPAEQSAHGMNTLTCTFDMKGLPPGRYLAEINNKNTGAFRWQGFEIVSPITWGWIRVNPIGETHVGKPINITGGTNLNADSVITITPVMQLHLCPKDKPLFTWGTRDFCDGTCNFRPEPSTVKVRGNANKNMNSWKGTIDTRDWCEGETYWINASVSNWTNVTPGSAKLRFGGNTSAVP